MTNRLLAQLFGSLMMLFLLIADAAAHEPTRLSCKGTPNSDRWMTVIVHVAEPGDSYRDGIAWFSAAGGPFVGENLTFGDGFYRTENRQQNKLFRWELIIYRFTGEATLWINEYQAERYLCVNQSPKF